MKMIVTMKLAAAAAACMMITMTMRGNLIPDGGFESGNAWDDYWGEIGVDSYVASGLGIGGSWAAVLPVPTGGWTCAGVYPKKPGAWVTGQQYTFEFFVKPQGSGTLEAICLGTIIKFNFTDSSSDYIPIEIPLTATGADNIIIRWSLASGPIYVDNVSLEPVPEPSTYLSGALLLVPFGLSLLRVVRNKCSA